MSLPTETFSDTQINVDDTRFCSVDNLSNKTSHSGTPGTDNNTLDTLLSNSFQRLDYNGLLIQYESDYQKDKAFEAELATLLMEVLLETRAWALARPGSETDRQGRELLNEVKGVETAEQEQGAYTLFDRARLALIHFVQNIKSALAALARV